MILRAPATACLRNRPQCHGGVLNDGGVWAAEALLRIHSATPPFVVPLLASFRKRLHTHDQKRHISSAPSSAQLEIHKQGAKRRLAKVHHCVSLLPDAPPGPARPSRHSWWRHDSPSWTSPLRPQVLRQRHEIKSTLADLSAWMSNPVTGLFGRPRRDHEQQQQLRFFPGGEIAWDAESPKLPRLAETIEPAAEAITLASGHEDARRVKHYIEFVGQQVKRKLCSARDVRHVLAAIPRALRQNCSFEDDLREYFLASLCLGIVEGLQASPACLHADFTSSDWNALLEHVMGLGHADDVIDLFARIMGMVPAERKPEVEDSAAALLWAISETWRDDMVKGAETVGTALTALFGEGEADSRVARTSEALRGSFSVSLVTATVLRCLDETVATSPQSPAVRAQVKAFWIAVVAHLPADGDMPGLFRTLTRIHRQLDTIDDSIICRLIMAQWTSRDRETGLRLMEPCRAVFNRWMREYGGQYSSALLAAALTYCRDAQKHVFLAKDLWRVMEGLRRGRNVVTAFAVIIERHHPLSTYQVQLAAMAADNHRYAIQLHSLVYHHSHILADRGLDWDWSGWAMYVRSMCVDEALDPMKILHLLGALDRTGDHHLNDASYGGVARRGRIRPSQLQVSLTESVIHYFAFEDRLDAQKSLTVVVRGVEWLLFCKAVVGETTIDAIRRVVVRYIEEDNTGCSRACAWLIRVMQSWQQTRGFRADVF